MTKKIQPGFGQSVGFVVFGFGPFHFGAPQSFGRGFQLFSLVLLCRPRARYGALFRFQFRLLFVQALLERGRFGPQLFFIVGHSLIFMHTR